MADPLTLSAVGWGISTAGWIISPIITRLLNKAFSHISSDESQKLHHLETYILPRLALTLEVVERSEHRVHFEQLVKELKSAFYEVEDILDDVEYCRLEKQISSKKRKNASNDGAGPSNQDVGSKSSWTRPGHWKSRLKGMVKKVEKPIDDAQKIIGLANVQKPAAPDPPCKDVGCKSSWTMPGPLKSRLKEMLEKIEKLIDEAQKIIGLANLPSDHSPEVAKYVQKPTAADPPRKVTGREEDRRRIISMLRENPSSSGGKNFSVIGIHGIPGSGKTTLAQYVCKYEDTAGYFQLVMWVHVSQNFRLDTIFSEMIEQATNKPCPQFRNLTALQKHLKGKLRGKRFLLVLDDVWDNKDLSQEEFSPLEVGEAGSKILVTSRTSDALLALGAVSCIPIPDLDERAFLELFMHYALEGAMIDGQDRGIFETIGADIAQRLKRSPLVAGTVGGQLRIRPNVDFWRRVRDRDVLDTMGDTMGALWWSYQHLDEQARRCFAYCSIFPRRYRLKRDKLVNFWVAEGFIKTTEIGEEMEDVARDYFDDLVSTSFLQLVGGGQDYYTIHDLLHDLAENVAGSDCFRIERGWTGEVPQDVRHLFVETYNRALFAEKILKLKNLRTLIIIGSCTMIEEIEDEDFESMFTRLRKLRILSVPLERESQKFSVPASIGKLQHIRYLAIKTGSSFEQLILPSTFSKLYHMQVLDFGSCIELVFYPGQDMSNLINLRHILALSHLYFPNIIRLTSLQTLPFFVVRKEQGYELCQLRDLNKLRGRLEIGGLGNVGSKEEALEANLAAKERITELELTWNRLHRRNAELQAEILEGLCPPMGLEKLRIDGYNGSRYPDWMVGNKNGPRHLQRLILANCSWLGAIPDRNEFFVHLRGLVLEDCSWNALPDNMEHLTSLEELIIIGYKGSRYPEWMVGNKDGPKHLQRLELDTCSPLGEMGVFVHLRVLTLRWCSWDALPDNMEHLTSLEELIIIGCENIRSLPTLPQSLEYLDIDVCGNIRSLPTLPQSLESLSISRCNDVFMTSCETIGDPNWQNIQHVPNKYFFKSSIHV